MIKRIWHGYTTRENASAYLALLQGEVIPGIEARKINGYRGIDVLRKDNGDEIEFVTIMTFDSIDNVKEFQGEDYEACHVPDAARQVLSRWDKRSLHYEFVDRKSAT